MQKIHYEVFGYRLDILQRKGLCRRRTWILNTKQHVLDLNQAIIKMQNYTTLIWIKPFQKCKTTHIWYEASHLRNTKRQDLDLNQAIIAIPNDTTLTWMKPSQNYKTTRYWIESSYIRTTQDRQCTYNMRRVHATIVAVEKHYLCMKHPCWCNNHRIYQYFQSQPTNTLQTILLRSKPLSTVNSGHHQVMIKEY
jgi:hypothetical protein